MKIKSPLSVFVFKSCLRILRCPFHLGAGFLLLVQKLSCLGVFIYFLSSAPLIDAKDPDGLTIHTSSPSVMTPVHLFGNQPIEFPIVLSGEIDRFENIHAQLIQYTSSLEVPNGEPIPVDIAGVAPASHELDRQISLILPAVKRETSFGLRFTATDLGNKEQVTIGEVPLILYPQELVEPVKTWSQNVQLRVKDPLGTLTKFLETQNIRFDDFQSPASIVPGESVVNMVTVNPDDRFRKEDYIKTGQTTVFFLEKGVGLPHVLAVQGADRQVIEVNMELLKNLDHDPQAQKMFLEIVQLSANKEQ